MTQIQKSEWRWVYIYAVLLAVVLSVPYLVGFATQTPESRFSGALIGTEDLYSYFAKMNQGAHGAWLFTLPYSSEKQDGTPLYLFYLLLGKLSGEDYTARVVVYHLARIAIGFALTCIIYRFQAEFLPGVNQRRLALVITTLGGGFGWLLIISGQWNLFGALPLEFASPEAYSFLMMLTLPHLLAARCLMLLALLAFLGRKYLWAGLLLLPVSLIQPAIVGIVWGVIGVAQSIQIILEKDFSLKNLREKFAPVALVVLLSAPLMLYLGYLFITNPILKQWTLQNLIYSSNPVHYVSGYGLYLVLALWGLSPLKKNRPDLWGLTIGWTLIVPLLLNAPIGVQRRLVEGYQIPLVALATLGLTDGLFRYRRWLIPLTIFLVLPSNLLLWNGTIQSVLGKHDALFRQADELAIFDWLNKNGPDNQVVLSTFSTGNALPAYTHMIAFIGHSSETVFLVDKTTQVERFYNTATSPTEKLDILRKNQIDYILYGPKEKTLGTFDPSTLPNLIKRFEQGDYAIYELTSP